MNKKIIAFSGTHGTGKSFSAYNLAVKLKLKGHNVVVLDELARECPLKINQEASLLTQYWILSSQIKKEIKLSQKYDYVIADRSILDTLSYAVTLKLIREIGDDSIIIGYVKDNYKKIILLDPDGFNYHISDGVRDMDVKFRQEVHDNLRAIYDRHNIGYFYATNNDELEKELNKLY